MSTSDPNALRARIDAARVRERTARAEAARLRRELAAADRRRETQMLCVLGRAWISLGERSESFRTQAQRFLHGYVTRQTDYEVLIGSAWEVPALTSHVEPTESVSESGHAEARHE